MIRDRMKSYDAETKVSGTDDYGQPLNSYEPYKTVEVSVTLLTKVINELDLRYLKSTHLGLTYDKTLKEGMRLSDITNKYMVKIVNNDGRMSQLTLELT